MVELLITQSCGLPCHLSVERMDASQALICITVLNPY